jgi:hypothetical protein
MNMKKNIYSFALLLVTVFFCSCEDFLTVESPDKLTSEKYWRNESDAEKGLAAAYSKLEHFIDTWEFAEVRWPVEAYREDIINPGKDAMNYLNWVELSKFTYTNGNSQINLYWKSIYRGINYANQVIEKVPNIEMDPTYRDQILNEAYFLRAYYHMKLLLNWKEIVIRDTYLVTVSSDKLGKPLSTREEAWNFIIEDLKKAQKLPATLKPEQLGRATAGAANAYLGFAYLTRAYEIPEKKTEYLTAALNAFNEVKGYSLVKEFRDMFNGKNQNSPESVFELQCTMNSADGAHYKTQMHMWIASSELGGWDEILPNQMLVDEYKKEGKSATTGRYDTRAYETLFFEDEYFNGGGDDAYGLTYDERFGKGGRAVFRKLLPPTLAELKQSRVGYNIPLMRYANVLLMKAEALNELGRTNEAIPYINEVREVHGDMPPMTGTSAEAVRAQIEHERILEFPLENYRFYDLRRWGKTKEALKAVGRDFDPAKNDFYPTPLTELNSNDQIQK